MTEVFNIQSDVANIPLVEERLAHFCSDNNVGNYYSAVSVATVQALKNAIVHGCGQDNSQSVSVAFGNCHGGIYVEVTDSGAGFNYDAFGDLPTDGSKGTGIFIMKSLADRITYSEGGRKVRMEFDVAGIDPADALERIAVLKEHFSLVAA